MTLHYGRLPPHPRWTHPRTVLDLHADMAAMAAGVPAVVDWTANVPSYPMYLNDQLGDCAEAGLGHALQSVTAATGTLITPTDADIQALYETQGYVPGDPSTDNGTNLQDLLTEVQKNPWCGMEIVAFAELRNWSASNLRTCLYYFKTVYVGVSFPASGMTQFQGGQPWVPVPGDPIEGGHCIVLEEVTTGMDQLNWITWGAKQKSNRAWWRTYAEEAWVIVTPEVLASPPPGLNAVSLMDEFHALG
jgi:hypothetical protein